MFSLLQLANYFLEQFDPSFKLPRAPPKDEHYLLPVFTMPQVQHTVLPGGYHYLKVYRPGYKKNVLLRVPKPDFVSK